MANPFDQRTHPGLPGGIVLVQQLLLAGMWVALTKGWLWLAMPLTLQHLVTA